jgi:transmembrane sensor
MFRVAKDPRRPFIVTAGGARVTAVGTEFSVSRNDDAVVVTVTEGRVKVMSARDAAGDPGPVQRFAEISLQANERVSVSAAGTAGPIHRIESSPTSGWGENQLVFENTRVADVVAQFNRINHIQIRITDNALNSRTVSGVFAANDPRSFVEFLQAVAGTASVDNGPDQIVVTPIATGTGPNTSSN